MFTQLTISERKVAIHRLTALWALNECGLGGLLHAIQSPVTGLIVGSIAMVCIAMIASITQNRWREVMQALVIVLIIKALVSPHSSPTAYFAVAFQGVTGALIFRWIPSLVIASLLFAITGLVESALQRLITLTIVYGNSLWHAIDLWGEWVVKKWEIVLPLPSSQLIIIAYLTVHVVAGFLVGLLIRWMIISVDRHWGQRRHQIEAGSYDFAPGKKKKKKWKSFAGFIILLILIITAYMLFDDTDGIMQGLYVMVRAILLLGIWFFFVAPLVSKWFRRYFAGKKNSRALQVEQTMSVFPHLLWIIRSSWQEAKGLSFLTRIRTFLLNTLLYILQFTQRHDHHPDRADEKR